MKNLTLLLSLALFSCDPGSTDYYYMNNQSDSTIYITYKATRATEDRSVSFPPHTINKMCDEEGHLGTYGDAGSYFLNGKMDSLNIYTDAAYQHKIRLDGRNRMNWIHRSERDSKGSRSGSDHYTLVLDNDDL